MATRDPYATTAGRALLDGFVQTDEMRAADEAIANSSPETEPENWTFINSMGRWIYTGPLAQKNTATQKATYAGRNVGGPNRHELRQWKTGAWGWLHGGDMMEQAAPGEGAGFGNFTQDSWDRYSAMGWEGNPLIDTSPHDIDEILALYQTDRFNPYAHYNYAANDKEIREGSVADVLYGLTKDRNQRKRMATWRAIQGVDGDLAQMKMTHRFWNQQGLNDVFGDYNDYVDNPFATNPLIARDRSGDTTGDRYLTGGGDRGTLGEMPSTSGRRGFLGAYQAKRAEQEAERPSVRSLFKEMQDYEEE